MLEQARERAIAVGDVRLGRLPALAFLGRRLGESDDDLGAGAEGLRIAVADCGCGLRVRIAVRAAVRITVRAVVRVAERWWPGRERTTSGQ
eukprot:1993702-Prymnesium_polylepis.1